MIKLLFLGDVVGEPGRKAACAYIRKFLKEGGDFAVVNGENAAGGRGITPKIAIDLLRSGAAVVTTGDHAWDQKDIGSYMAEEPRLLRPLNYPSGAPGQGSVVLDTRKGKIAVLNLQGRTFMHQLMENPFHYGLRHVQELRKETGVILVDFHAETTSEKIAMGRFLDGQVSAVVGTHTHVQTADEKILPQGTGFLCDAGMCGPEHSILGRDPKNIIRKFLDGLPTRYPVGDWPVRVCGAIFEVDEESGHCKSVTRVSHLIEREEA